MITDNLLVVSRSDVPWLSEVVANFAATYSIQFFIFFGPDGRSTAGEISNAVACHFGPFSGALLYCAFRWNV